MLVHPAVPREGLMDTKLCLNGLSQLLYKESHIIPKPVGELIRIYI